MSTQSQDRKVQLDDKHVEAVLDKADSHVLAISKALEELDTAITGRDFPTADHVIGNAFKASDQLHEHLEEDIARLVDAIRPQEPLTSEQENKIEDAGNDVMTAYSILRTVKNSLEYRNQVKDGREVPGTTHEEFIEDLRTECLEIHGLLFVSNWQQALKRLPKLQLSLRVLRMSVDWEARTDEHDVIEVAQYRIERAEMTLGEVQS